MSYIQWKLFWPFDLASYPWKFFVFLRSEQDMWSGATSERVLTFDISFLNVLQPAPSDHAWWFFGKIIGGCARIDWAVNQSRRHPWKQSLPQVSKQKKTKSPCMIEWVRLYLLALHCICTTLQLPVDNMEIIQQNLTPKLPPENVFSTKHLENLWRSTYLKRFAKSQ